MPIKGIVLAGGSGTRLYPATLAVNKQLLPIYDKPMIYYSVSVLMLAQVRDILLISSPEHIGQYQKIFGDGTVFGINMSYAVQEQPNGLAQAFVLGREFVGDSQVALILGDNVFFGAGMISLLHRVSTRQRGATIFGYRVENPQDYGVITLDGAGRATSIEEKPAQPKSDFAIPGLYFCDNRVLDIAAAVKPSPRGEYEITDVIRAYMEMGELYVEILSRGYAWLDTGTHESLLEASEFVRTIQNRQGIQIACLEEIAYMNGFIDREQLRSRGKLLEKTAYGRYLLELSDHDPGLRPFIEDSH